MDLATVRVTSNSTFLIHPLRPNSPQFLSQQAKPPMEFSYSIEDPKPRGHNRARTKVILPEFIDREGPSGQRHFDSETYTQAREQCGSFGTGVSGCQRPVAYLMLLGWPSWFMVNFSEMRSYLGYQNRSNTSLHGNLALNS